MRFRDFITRQRVAIFIIGLVAFAVCLTIAHVIGVSTLWGELLDDLAASSLTIIFTVLIIDYFGLEEERDKTQNAAVLAEDEIRAICFRIKWRLARLFGLERRDTGPRHEHISTPQEARDYLDEATERVEAYLANHSLMQDATPVDEKALPSYLERLQTAQNELEQTLILYEYALSYEMRERALGLRSELQVAERVLGFIDTSDDAEPLSEANVSLVRVTAQAVYDAVQLVLEYEAR